MSKRINCQTCAAFSAMTLECRRRAPEAAKVVDGSGRPGVSGIYPATRAEGWCLDWISEAHYQEMLQGPIIQ